MIIAPELSIDVLEDYADDQGRINIDVTVPSDFLAEWRAAEEAEWVQHDPSRMSEVVEKMLEEIFGYGEFPETMYESLEEKEGSNDTGYDIECVFSFDLA